MKAGVTYVPRSELEAIARAEGCKIEEQRSFFKITKPGSKSDNKLYLAKTVNVARVDLSGFKLKDSAELVRNLGGESFGMVHQMLRFDRTAEEISAAFRFLCRELVTFESLPKKPKGRPVGLKGSKKLTTPVQIQLAPEADPATEIATLKAKLTKLQEFAKSRNMPVSPKTIAQIENRINELQPRITG